MPSAPAQAGSCLLTGGVGDGGDRAKQPWKPAGQLKCLWAPCPADPGGRVTLLPCEG